MVIAYHAIFTTYGAWLANDPRGSYSKEIYQAELAALGEIRYGRQNPQPSRETVRRFRTAAVRRLSRLPCTSRPTRGWRACGPSTGISSRRCRRKRDPCPGPPCRRPLNKEYAPRRGD